MQVLLKLFLAIVPLLITVLLAWLVMAGYLNLGGGEKDIFLVVPLLIWSMVYLCCFLALWLRRSSIGRSVAVSAGFATGLVVIAFVVLFSVSWFKFR
jgi:hypothetical protein